MSSVVSVFKNAGQRSMAKNYHPVSLLSEVRKIFEKLVNNRLLYHLKKCDLFLILSIALGLLDQLWIFWELYLTELLGMFIGLGLLSCSTWYIWDFLRKKLKSYGTSGQIVCLFLGSLYQFTQLMLVFLKAPFSGLHLSYYTSMTFLMLLSVILHSMLLLLSTSKSDQASDLWQQLELASELECGHCRLGQDIACWFQSRKN